MRNIIFILFVTTIFVNNSCHSQQKDLLLSVLKKDQVNKVFSFDSSNKKEGLYQIFITYLGSVKSNNKDLKIIIRKTIWGPNHHTSGSIYLYNVKNVYVGKYDLGSGLDLPSNVKNNQLIFMNKDKPSCDSNMVTYVDFSPEIPQKFFLKCKGEYGDVYLFSTKKD